MMGWFGAWNYGPFCDDSDEGLGFRDWVVQFVTSKPIE